MKERRYLIEVSEIKQEILFLVGQHDRNTGVEIGKDLMKRISNASTEIFSDNAHFPDIEETKKYADIVKSFLSKGKSRLQ